MRITAAVPGKVNFELDIQKYHTNRLGIIHGGYVTTLFLDFSPPIACGRSPHSNFENGLDTPFSTIASMVDASGSLAVASRGLFATGVSTDLNVTYLNSGGKVGDTIRGEVLCDKC